MDASVEIITKGFKMFTRQKCANVSKTLNQAKETLRILHPLPRVNEISPGEQRAALASRSLHAFCSTSSSWTVSFVPLLPLRAACRRVCAIVSAGLLICALVFRGYCSIRGGQGPARRVLPADALRAVRAHGAARAGEFCSLFCLLVACCGRRLGLDRLFAAVCRLGACFSLRASFLFGRRQIVADRRLLVLLSAMHQVLGVWTDKPAKKGRGKGAKGKSS
jgi:hypothetical protein